MKILLTFLLMTITLLAQEVFSFKKGWQLMGPTQNQDVTSYFDHPDVKQVWGFDASTQTWKGFSPDSTTQKRINTKYKTLQKVLSYQAVWVLSAKEWEKEIVDTDIDITQPSGMIELKKGWNLLSLPSKSVVTPDIFPDDVTIWKKPFSGPWEYLGSDENNATVLTSLNVTEGFWVKSPKEQTIDLPRESAKLKPFRSHQAMQDFLYALTQKRPYFYGCFKIISPVEPIFLESITENVALGTTKSASTVTNTTTTNTQEVDVDESDYIKHDGKHIFYADLNHKKIRISSFSLLAESNASLDPHIDLNISHSYHFKGMYLQKNTLSVVTSSFTSSTLTFYDVSDLSNIQQLKTYTIDGRLKESRLSNSQVKLITRYEPQIRYEYPTVIINGKKQTDYAHPIVHVEKLFATMTTDHNTTQEIIEHTKTYATRNLDQRPTTITISTFDLDTQAYQESLSYIGNANVVYASSNALYLTSRDYGRYYSWNHFTKEETIYKIDWQQDLRFVGATSIKGHSLNQFSLSEYNNTLRVAATDQKFWWDSETNNYVYTIKEHNNSFNVIASLDGLGLERETIKAARFLGTRGFIVTFRQTDPLYTLDLSDPYHPKVVGELKIPGYSKYFHPIDENRIMSIGRDANESTGRDAGLQLQLFDISDFANPKLVDKIIYGTNSWEIASNLEYNHKALAYRSSDHMFAFPYTTRKYTRYYEDGLERYRYDSNNTFVVYQIEGMRFKAINAIDMNASRYFYENDPRAILFDMDSKTYAATYSAGIIEASIIKE